MQLFPLLADGKPDYCRRVFVLVVILPFKFYSVKRSFNYAFSFKF